MKYMELKIEKTVFEFMCTYVRRIKPDVKWKKLMTNNPGSPFFCMVTPSIIAYVLAIIKNGKELCVCVFLASGYGWGTL